MDYSAKKLMVMGDNPESYVLVKAANDLGIRTVVVGININTRAKTAAWKAFDVNALDVDALEKIAREEKIDGVVVGVADILVPSYTELCARMGFPAYSTRAAVQFLCHKSLFKEQLAKVGLPVIPEYQGFSDYNNIPLPVFVKPVDCGGGVGISIVARQEDLLPAIEHALNCSHTRTIQIEKYMHGDVVACYYTIIDGKVYLSSLEDNLFTRQQGALCPVTIGHTYASKYLGLYFEKYHDKICQLLANVSAANGVLQINAFVENGKFYFYDPGYRLQGEAQHHILKAVNGFDHLKMLIDFALTGKMYDGDFSEVNHPGLKGKKCASIWPLLRAGQIERVEGIREIAEDPRIVFNGQRFFEGSTVESRFLGTERQVFSRLYAVTDTKEELYDIVAKINTDLKVLDKDGNNMILDVLSPEAVY